MFQVAGNRVSSLQQSEIDNTRALGMQDTQISNNKRSVLCNLFFCIVAFALAGLPIILPGNLFLIDYPEHLAHFYTREHLPQSPELQRYYKINEGTYPYWGIRIVVGSLTHFLSVESALRWFTVIAALMPAAGACVLGWTLSGRITLFPLLSLFFVHNAILNWGFLNYLFSGGVALVVFAGWVGSIRCNFSARLLGLGFAAICLIWMHPVSAVLLGLFVALWEFAKVVREAPADNKTTAGLGKLFLVCVAFIPAGVSLLMLTEFGHPDQFTHLGALSDKLKVAFSPFWMGQSRYNILPGFAAILLITVPLLQGYLRIETDFGRLVLYLIVVAFVAPSVLFGVHVINVRLPVFIIMVYIASLHITNRAYSHRLFSPTTAMLVALFLVKLSITYSLLYSNSKKVTELRQVATIVPIGSKVLMAIDQDTDHHPGPSAEPPYQNLDSYLIVDRQSFVPNIFGSVGIGYQEQHSSHFKLLGGPVRRALLDLPFEQWPSVYQSHTRFAGSWQNDYEYILLIDFSGRSQPPLGTKSLHSGTYFQILQIKNS